MLPGLSFPGAPRSEPLQAQHPVEKKMSVKSMLEANTWRVGDGEDVRLAVREKRAACWPQRAAF